MPSMNPDQPTEEPSTVEFITVARVGAIPRGEGRAFPVKGRMIAVFYIDNEYHAINDFCPHMGASLADGSVEDGVVACPWHAWRFKLSDGTWCDNPRIKTDSFAVRVRGDEVQVAVPEKASMDDDAVSADE